jgi:hypothetical protein
MPTWESKPAAWYAATVEAASARNKIMIAEPADTTEGGCVFRSSGPQITVMMGQSRSEATLAIFCLSDPAHMNQEKPK